MACDPSGWPDANPVLRLEDMSHRDMVAQVGLSADRGESGPPAWHGWEYLWRLQSGVLDWLWEQPDWPPPCPVATYVAAVRKATCWCLGEHWSAIATYMDIPVLSDEHARQVIRQDLVEELAVAMLYV